MLYASAAADIPAADSCDDYSSARLCENASGEVVLRSQLASRRAKICLSTNRLASSKRFARPFQARMASINAPVPSIFITRFML